MMLKLNKSIFLIPVFLLFTGVCSAQQHFKGGLSIGIATTQVSGDTYAGFNKLGLMGGGFVQLSISDKLAAQFEINYIQKGSRKIADPNNGDFSEYLMKLGYVEIPLLVRFYIEKASLEIGPSLGLLVSLQETGVNGQSLTGSEFNFIDLGLNLGLSY